MYKRTILLTNKEGLDEQLAIDFINKASEFESRIRVKAANGDEDANAKSIIMVTGLELENGREIELNAVGEDEIAAVDALADLIEFYSTHSNRESVQKDTAIV